MICLMFGAMFSGKTTLLINKLERQKISGKNVCLLRSNHDTRGYLTHDFTLSKVKETFFVDDLSDFKAEKYDAIGIDEGQFHTNLKNFCIKYNNKLIYISALHADINNEMFKQVIEVIPYCDKIIKLNSVCKVCGSQFANYNIYKNKKVDINNSIKVGGHDLYYVLCSKCFYTMHNQ